MVELPGSCHSVCLSTNTALTARGTNIIHLTLSQECDGMALPLQTVSVGMEEPE